MAAADVGDPPARGQPLLDAVERRDPRLDDVGAVAGLEEALAAGEHVVVVLAPAEAGAGDEGLGDVLAGIRGSERELEAARHEGGAAGVGEHQRLLDRHRVAVAGGVVVDPAAGGLGAEPFADVALRGAGALGELGGGQRAAGGELAIEAEAVADHDQRGVDRGAELDDGLAEKRVQALLVDEGCCGGGSHAATVGAAPHPRLRGPTWSCLTRHLGREQNRSRCARSSPRSRAASRSTGSGSATRSSASGPGTILLTPAWAIVSSRYWKAPGAVSGAAVPRDHVRRARQRPLGPAGGPGALRPRRAGRRGGARRHRDGARARGGAVARRRDRAVHRRAAPGPRRRRDRARRQPCRR